MCTLADAPSAADLQWTFDEPVPFGHQCGLGDQEAKTAWRTGCLDGRAARRAVVHIRGNAWRVTDRRRADPPPRSPQGRRNRGVGRPALRFAAGTSNGRTLL